MVTDFVTFGEKRKGLSKRESYLLSYLSGNGKTIFSLRDVIDVLKCSYDNAKMTVERLVRKKWIVRVMKGKYLIVPLSAGVEGRYSEHEFIIASLFKPAYVGYWTALNYYGFTEQIPNIIFVVTRRKLRSRVIFGVEFRFVYLSERKFFGFAELNISGYSVYISDKEKTIVDCLDKPRYCGGMTEVMKAFSMIDELNIDRLTVYAIKMSGVVVKRLGLILDMHGIDSKLLKENVSGSYAVFDPTREGRGRYNSKWRVVVNLSKEELNA